jgi:hypothetical protein
VLLFDCRRDHGDRRLNLHYSLDVIFRLSFLVTGREGFSQGRALVDTRQRAACAHRRRGARSCASIEGVNRACPAQNEIRTNRIRLSGKTLMAGIGSCG